MTFEEVHYHVLLNSSILIISLLPVDLASLAPQPSEIDMMTFRSYVTEVLLQLIKQFLFELGSFNDRAVLVSLVAGRLHNA